MTNCWKQVVLGALVLSCQSQRINVIQTGHKVLQALLSAGPSEKSRVAKIILPAAEEVLNLSDEWEYRRLLELLDSCSLKEQLKLLISQGLTNKDPEISETAKEWNNGN